MNIKYFRDSNLDFYGLYKGSTKTIYINQYIPFYVKPVTLLHEVVHYFISRIEKRISLPPNILDLIFDISCAIIIRWDFNLVKWYLDFYSGRKEVKINDWENRN
ncbi:hypothetical protein ES703_08241 [subsurface metagenome]